MHHVYVWCLGKPEGGIRSPGTGLQMVVRHLVGIEN